MYADAIFFNLARRISVMTVHADTAAARIEFGFTRFSVEIAKSAPAFDSCGEQTGCIYAMARERTSGK